MLPTKAGYSRITNLQDGLILITGKCTLDSLGDTSALVAPGVSTCAKTATGKYRVTMQDKYPGGVHFGHATITKSGGVLQHAHVDAEAMAASGTVDFLFDTMGNNLVGDTTGDVANPTTPSTQATGGAGVTVWRVNVAEYRAQIWEGTTLRTNIGAAAADTVIHDTTCLFPLVNDDCVAAVVAKVAAGVWALQTVKGAVVTGGGAVAPTDAQITAAVTHANWVKLAETRCARSADTAVTQTHYNANKQFGKGVQTASTPISATLSFVLFLDGTSTT